MAGNGAFSGYLNWRQDKRFSTDAGKLRANGRCPRRSGDLALAGKGVTQCEYCGSELFLSAG